MSDTDARAGALYLNLLGIVITLNQVVLNITAVPGGGLLGDLLCAIANLLQGGNLQNLSQNLLGLLQKILQALQA